MAFPLLFPKLLKPFPEAGLRANRSPRSTWSFLATNGSMVSTKPSFKTLCYSNIEGKKLMDPLGLSDMTNSKKMIHSKLGFRPKSLELVKYLEKLWTCCCHVQWSPSAWKNVHLKARLCKWKTVESTKIELQMGGSKYTPLMKRLICITNVYYIYTMYL